MYFFLRSVARAFVAASFRLEVRGQENMPTEGPCIIAANHIHALDPLPIAIAVNRQIHFMAKEEMFGWPVVGWLARRAGVFPVKRGQADVQAIRQALKLLSAGEVLGIFPEGTRSKTGEMQEAFAGVPVLAARARATVVPVGIAGSYRFRGVIRVNFGEPMHFTGDNSGKLSPEAKTQATNDLMQHIRNLVAECRRESW